jgi:hypothetical protein
VHSATGRLCFYSSLQNKRYMVIIGGGGGGGITWPLTRRRNYRLRKSEKKKVQEDYLDQRGKKQQETGENT